MVQAIEPVTSGNGIMTTLVRVFSLLRFSLLVLKTLVACGAEVFLLGQDFQNLDFESANTNGLTIIPYREPTSGQPRIEVDGPTSVLLPGWQITYQGKPLTDMSLDPNPLTHPDFQPPSLHSTIYGFQSFQGRYAFDFAVKPGDSPTTISQRGKVPSGAKMLTFQANGLWDVSFNGQNLRFLGVIDGSKGIEGWDISPMAGQNGLLTIATSHILAVSSGMDSITFTTVPEPRSLRLALIGFIALLPSLLLKHRRFRRAHET